MGSNNILENISKSLNTKSEGWSGRKLSALNCIIMANIISIVGCVICYKNKESIILLYFVIAWLVTAAVFLGMVTIPQLITALKTIKGESTYKPEEENSEIENKKETE